MANKKEFTPTVAGANLKQMRILAGHTQQSLADAAEVSQRTISAIEKGRIAYPTYQTAFALAKVLQCEPDDFMEMSFNKKKKSTSKAALLKAKLGGK